MADHKRALIYAKSISGIFDRDDIGWTARGDNANLGVAYCELAKAHNASEHTVVCDGCGWACFLDDNEHPEGCPLCSLRDEIGSSLGEVARLREALGRAERERDEAREQVCALRDSDEWADKMEAERDAALQRAEAAERRAHVMEKALRSIAASSRLSDSPGLALMTLQGAPPLFTKGENDDAP